MSQIESEGWPVRAAAGQLIFIIIPGMIVGLALTNLIIPGPSLYGLSGLIIFPSFFLLVSLFIGTGWPDWVRRRALRYQMKGWKHE